MNNELAKGLAEKFNQTYDYAVQYLPDLMNRYLTYLIYTDLLCMGLTVLADIGLISLLKYANKNTKNPDSMWYDDEPWAILIVLSVVLTVLSLIFILGGLFELIKLNTIPEIAVLEHLTK